MIFEIALFLWLLCLAYAFAMIAYQLFQGKAGDAAGGCGIFPGLQVSAKGWCSAYVKKA